MSILDRGCLPPICLYYPSSLRGRGVSARRGFTLVEMLIAMALTLLMMSAVLAVFTSVSDSVGNRRANMEMSGQLRHARTVLQADLANLTSPAIPNAKPEANQGFFEIVEGPMCDMDPSIMLRDEGNDGVPDVVFQDSMGGDVRLDLATSQLPSSTLFRLPGSSVDVTSKGGVTDGGALGDWDDVLMLTVRNDNQPFVGRVPDAVPTTGAGFANWGSRAIESPLAEVIWFAVENPLEEDESYYFGEPGLRTVYRRAFLIAPWLDYGIVVNNVRMGPGVVRVLPDSVDDDEFNIATAALIAFQERYDVCVRLEWNPLVGQDGRWMLLANTLADVTKRENRTEHGIEDPRASRSYPYRSVSRGGAVAGSITIGVDPESRQTAGVDAVNVNNNADGMVVDGSRADALVYTVAGQLRGNYSNRPVTSIPTGNGVEAPTVRAILNESGEIVAFTNGMVPLSGERRGEDVMLSNMLAFDLKVYDPEAPMLAELPDTSNSNYPGEVVGPDSPAWGVIARQYYRNGAPTGNDAPVVRRGAYVDLGYYSLHAYFAYRNQSNPNLTAWPSAGLDGASELMGNSVLGKNMDVRSRLGSDAETSSGYGFQPYRTYDTWSFSYENNGIDDDGQFGPDQATDGFDNDGLYGVDDPGEREAPPPYDTPLRGVQVTLRAYELDSRSIREVNVKQTFVPK